MLVLRISSMNEIPNVGDEIKQENKDIAVSYHSNSDESRGYLVSEGKNNYYLKIIKPGRNKSFLEDKERVDMLFSSLKREAEKANIVPQTYLYVDKEYCLVVYEDGNILTDTHGYKDVDKLLDKAQRFIDRNNIRLFQNVGIDLMPTNFIEGSDGNLFGLILFTLIKY